MLLLLKKEKNSKETFSRGKISVCQSMARKTERMIHKLSDMIQIRNEIDWPLVGSLVVSVVMSLLEDEVVVGVDVLEAAVGGRDDASFLFVDDDYTVGLLFH